MPAFSEKTFGARIHNARTLLTNLSTFAGYNPPDVPQSIAGYQNIILQIENQNNYIASAKGAYSDAVEKRQKLFQKDDDSLEKIMTPLVAAVRSSFGRKSKQVSDIKAMIKKIYGTKLKNKSTTPKATPVSQSERSFGSRVKTFADIVTTLSDYGDKYKPGDPILKADALKLKVAMLIQANNNVTLAASSLKQKRDDRIVMYKQLAGTTLDIKDSVKSQYRTKSSEFNLIKGILV